MYGLARRVVGPRAVDPPSPDPCRLVPSRGLLFFICVAGFALPAAGQSTSPSAAPTVSQLPVPSVPPDSEPRAPTVTLDEAVRLALTANPRLARANALARGAHAGERTAAAAYLPTLALESNTIRASTPSPISQPGSVGGLADRTAAAGFAASYDVFTGGRRSAERRRATAEGTAADADVVASRYDVMLETERAFYDELRARDLTGVAEARVARAIEALAAAKLRHEVGTATSSDELRARLELADAQAALLQARADRHAALFALGRAVGRDGPVRASADSAETARPNPLMESDSAIVAYVVANAPSVTAARASAGAAQAGLTSARSRYAPSLQLTSGYRWIRQPSNVGLAQEPAWDVRLGLSYALFDGLQREEGVTRAEAERDASDRELTDARLAARAEAERILAALHVSEQRIALAEEAVRVSREDLRVITARYRAGVATILDRITSQLNLTNAEAELVTLRYDDHIARAELSALAGRAY